MEKSPLTIEENDKPTIKAPNYTKEQQIYLRNLAARLSFAREQREQPRQEFDGMSYSQYWLANEQGANTTIKPKKDKKEITFQSGTLRQKMMAFVASLVGLNLKPDVMAFDENDINLVELGQAMEDIIDKTNELEGDDEKQVLRQYELLKHGDVFIEEVWEEEEKNEKEVKEEFNGKFNHIFWKKKTEKTNGNAVKNIVCGLNVYLGDIKQYFIENQPYIFTRASMNYAQAEQIYGQWEMWQYVARQITSFDGNEQDRILSGSFALITPSDGEVEILKFQDKLNNEYQILINGVPMLPIGAPRPWGNYYNITQQHLEPIRENFAYGKSFIFRNKSNVYLIDELIKMALLKTWKSFMPPMLNTSGQYINSNVLMPGKITQGIPANSLVPVEPNQSQGVTNGELAMINQMTAYVDQNTASQTFSGQIESGQTTATQIVEMQRQSRIMMGLMILAASSLEKKITYLRLNNILQNWFDPIDQDVDKARNELVNRYRIISRSRMIEGEGQGVRFVIPTEEQITPEQLMMIENGKKQELGMPVRMILLDPRALKQAKKTWYINVVAKEKKSSELSKVMFGEMIQQATQVGLQLNPQYVQEQFGAVWEKDPAKLFIQAPQMPQNGVQMPGVGQQPSNQPMGVQKPSLGQMTKAIDNKQI